MRVFYLVLLSLLLSACASLAVKPELLTGKWGLVATEEKGVVLPHAPGLLTYRFYASGRLVSIVRGVVYRGQWKVQGDRLVAWWPGRHREGHRVTHHTRDRLVLVSRDGELVSRFIRIR